MFELNLLTVIGFIALVYVLIKFVMKAARNPRTDLVIRFRKGKGTFSKSGKVGNSSQKNGDTE